LAEKSHELSRVKKCPGNDHRGGHVPEEGYENTVSYYIEKERTCWVGRRGAVHLKKKSELTEEEGMGIEVASSRLLWEYFTNATSKKMRVTAKRVL